MEEIWKEIKDYEGLYYISNLGRVKSLSKTVKTSIGYRVTKEKILIPGTNGGGYQMVGLYKNNITKAFRIHQLVSIAFLNHVPCGRKLVVNHKDFNRINNHVHNLEIITQRENANKKHLKSSSNYTGVHWCNTKKKWVSQIAINGKNNHLGYFLNEIDASNAYQNKLKQF